MSGFQELFPFNGATDVTHAFYLHLKRMPDFRTWLQMSHFLKCFYIFTTTAVNKSVRTLQEETFKHFNGTNLLKCPFLKSLKGVQKKE